VGGDKLDTETTITGVALPNPNFVDNHISIPESVKVSASGRESCFQQFLSGKLTFNAKKSTGLRVSCVPKSENSPPFSQRLGKATFIIKLVNKKHHTEDFEKNYIVINEDWEVWLDSKNWSFELLNLVTFERLKFVGRDFDIRRLGPCLSCEERGADCHDSVPCLRCVKKTGGSCRPLARYVSISEYGNLGVNATSIVLTGSDLLPFNTDGQLHNQDHVARAIRQHTIITNDPNTAVVLSSLPTPRDKRFLDERGDVFEKFTADLVKGLKEEPALS
jgi:hypothetical protein